MRARVLAGVRIVIAVTAPSSASFYAGQLAALRAAGAEVTFLAGPSDEVARQCAAEGAAYVPIAMERAPSPRRDLRALAQITAALRRLRPDLVNAGTPKAGLLGMLAAVAVRVPLRVHTLHGLRYEAAHGRQRQVLWLAQRASCAAATHVVCVSRSLRDRAVATHLLAPGQGVVIGDGTVNGVDPAQFCRDAATAAAGQALRTRLGIADDVPVVGYLGRLARDKGIGDLAAAWSARGGAPGRLLVAGEVDPTDPPDPADLARLGAAPDVHLLGHVADPVAFHAACDVLVLPTWREGFPTVPLEAAAMGNPVIATRATGCVDAVVDGVTGGLVPIGDRAALGAALARYLADPALRAQQGAAGRARVLERFTRARVHRLTVDFYRAIVHRGAT